MTTIKPTTTNLLEISRINRRGVYIEKMQIYVTKATIIKVSIVILFNAWRKNSIIYYIKTKKNYNAVKLGQLGLVLPALQAPDEATLLQSAEKPRRFHSF